MLILNNFPIVFCKQKSGILLMGLGRWNGFTQKQKSWKIVEKHGKFSVTVNWITRPGYGEEDGEAKDSDYKIFCLLFIFIPML